MLFRCIAIVGTPDVGEEMTEEVDTEVLESEEEASCTRLLAAAAERVWDIFVQNKREVSSKKGISSIQENLHTLDFLNFPSPQLVNRASLSLPSRFSVFCTSPNHFLVMYFIFVFQAMEDAFKIALPKPSFTSYSSRDYVEHM